MQLAIEKSEEKTEKEKRKREEKKMKADEEVKKKKEEEKRRKEEEKRKMEEEEKKKKEEEKKRKEEEKRREAEERKREAEERRREAEIKKIMKEKEPDIDFWVYTLNLRNPEKVKELIMTTMLDTIKKDVTLNFNELHSFLPQDQPNQEICERDMRQLEIVSYLSQISSYICVYIYMHNYIINHIFFFIINLRFW